MQGQLPRYTVATACYGEEPKSTSTMYFAKKLRINLLFPDVLLFHTRNRSHVAVGDVATHNGQQKRMNNHDDK